MKNPTTHAECFPTPGVNLRHDSPVWKSRTGLAVRQVRADWSAALIAGILVMAVGGELVFIGALIHTMIGGAR